MTEAEVSESIVREFWRIMATNDFSAVKPLLADDFVLEWPQSGERIRGAENFARVNAEYPTTGSWRFKVNKLIAKGSTVVTQVSVTDGTLSGEPVSFFTLCNGKIWKLIEYWPDPFAPQENRKHLVESFK